MRVTTWKLCAGTLLATAFGLMVNLAEAQQYFSPPPAPYVYDDSTGNSGGVETQLDVYERLRLAEAKIEALAQQTAEISRLPQTDDMQWTSAPGDPPLPSATGGLDKSVPQLVAPGKFPQVRLSGFFHLDTGAVSQDAANRAVLGDIQDGTGFRRARLQALGKVAEFTNYSLEMDFAIGGRPSFMDVWGEQTNLPIFGNLRIGQFRQPFSMDALTSVKQLNFLERSLPFQAFVPFRRVGIMAYDKSEDELWTLGYSIYRTGAFQGSELGDTRYATDIGDNGGYSFSTRMTHLLYYDELADGRDSASFLL